MKHIRVTRLISSSPEDEGEEGAAVIGAGLIEGGELMISGVGWLAGDDVKAAAELWMGLDDFSLAISSVL